MDIRKEMDRAKQSKIMELRSWALARRYLRSDQNPYFDSRGLVQAAAKGASGKSPAVVNLIVTPYRNLASRLAANWPGLGVRSTTPSLDGVMSAQADEMLLRGWWDSAEVERHYAEATQHILAAGTAGFFVTLDPSSLDINLRTVAPEDLFLDPEATTRDELRYIGVRTYCDKDELEELFPKIKDIKDKAQPASRRADLLQSGDTGLMVQSPSTDSMSCYYQVFTKDKWYIYSEGCDSYLYEGPNPTKPYFPVSLMRMIVLPTEVWGLGIVPLLVGIQAQYNKTKRQISDNADLLGNPKVAVMKGSGLERESLRAIPGEILYYNKGFNPPTSVPGAALPAYIVDMLRQSHSELLDVSGATAASLGKKSPGLNAAVAIDALTDNANTALQMTADEGEYAAKHMARNVLLLAQRYWKQGKAVRMLGRYGQSVFKELKSTDLIEDPEITIDCGALFHFQIQDRESRTLDMLKMQLITPEEAKGQLSSHTLGHKDAERLLSYTHATKLLNAQKAGKLIKLYETDDMQVCEEVWKTCITSDEYEKFPVPIQDAIEDVYLSIISYKPGTNPLARGVVYPPVPQPQATPGDIAGQLGEQQSLPGKAATAVGAMELANKKAETKALIGQPLNPSPELPVEQPIEQAPGSQGV